MSLINKKLLLKRARITDVRAAVEQGTLPESVLLIRLRSEVIYKERSLVRLRKELAQREENSAKRKV